MPDPLGDPAGNFSPFAFSRPTVMESLGLLRQSRRTARGEVGIGGMALGDLPPSIRVLVQNNTGADLPTFSVVALSGIIGSIDDADNGSYAFSRAPAFSATTPTAITDAFAILDEPCAYEAGGVGVLRRAVVQGVVPVDVNVTDSGHGYATPTASDNTKLTSATSGPARILYKPAGTGTLRCVVKLDESAAGTSSSLVTGESELSSNFAIGSAGSGSGSGWVDSGLSVTLPSAGTYLIYANVGAEGELSTSSVGLGHSQRAHIGARLYDSTDAAYLTDGGNIVTDLQAPAEVSMGSTSIQIVYTVSVSSVIQLHAARTGSYDPGGGQTWEISRLLSAGGVSGTGYETRMGYIKLG